MCLSLSLNGQHLRFEFWLLLDQGATLQPRVLASANSSTSFAVDEVDTAVIVFSDLFVECLAIFFPKVIDSLDWCLRQLVIVIHLGTVSDVTVSL